MKNEEKIFGFESWLWRLLLWPALIILLIFVSYFGVVKGRLIQANKNWQQQRELTKKSKDLIDKKNYLLSLDQDQVAEDLEFLEMALLKSRDAYYLVNVIREVAELWGFKVDSFVISPGLVEESQEAEKGKKDPTELLSKVPVEAVLKGPYKNHLEVIKGLEKALPIISIDDLDINSLGELAELKMRVSTYFASEKAEAKLASLSLADLILSQEEREAITAISSFSRVSGLNLDDQGLIKKRDFVDYKRSDPFSF